MAVAPTGAIYKALKFDGVSSRTYGVYITGEAVYNAPERDVEMITIPGRNGSFALDNGRFQNIEVSYPAGIFAETEADFRQAISDFRNFLCSRNGYVRLQDEYNPDEYRMAVYKSGLEVTPAQLKAGEFTITFDCKPQRWLTSGESAVTVESGDTITNPTLLEASPMIEASGYGTISINDEEIVIKNDPIGTITLFNQGRFGGNLNKTVTVDDTYANIGDVIRLGNTDCTVRVNSPNGWNNYSVNYSGDLKEAYVADSEYYDLFLDTVFGAKQFVYGSAVLLSGTANFVINTPNYGSLTVVVSASIDYNGTNTFTFSINVTVPNHITMKTDATYPNWYIGNIMLDSTQYAIGNPLYIDLDIGECYKIENNSHVSINNAVQIPAELPTLAPGVNTITFDNTITDFKVVPRWWKI